MNTGLNRRSFLKRSTLAAGILSAAPFNILHAANAGEKLRCVQIGCGGRAMEHLKATFDENLVAMVDVDEKRLDAVRKMLAGKGRDAGRVQAFTDYRKMFDKLGQDFDAVFIA